MQVLISYKGNMKGIIGWYSFASGMCKLNEELFNLPICAHKSVLVLKQTVALFINAQKRGE